ncbi:hypothetical protein QGM67_12400 [Vibrio cholerae]|uniref:hypothetical protein n=1 Tax=Vibrio cholerae TaxID=666 RepID=UPI0018F0C8A9|nr:hypothetical protein [Vibrio cholerae]MBJ6928171.1 hypothetical protein [Vibrio cholerae]MBJ6935449.1 hypothetical protein [Vibrio cholerae]MBJ6963172.1 hypothetical protein [Vibrio cholerae]MDH7615577.1 hypothetical protein [Vibrio cholerae]
MKNLMYWTCVLLLTVSVLVGNDLGKVNDGVVNLLLVATWINVVLMATTSVCILIPEKFQSLVERAKKQGMKRWMTKIRIVLLTLIACSYLYFGYWITGVVSLLAIFLVSVMLLMLQEAVEGKE